MKEIAADPAKGLDAAIAAVPELGQDRDDAGGHPRRHDRRPGAAPVRRPARGSGTIDRAGWEASVEFMTKLGLVPKPVTVDDLVSEDFVRRPEGGLGRAYHRVMPDASHLPDRPPFAHPRPGRCRHSRHGGTLHEPDGARRGRRGRSALAFVGSAAAAAAGRAGRRASTFGRGSSCPGWSTPTPTCRSCRTPGSGSPWTC